MFGNAPPANSGLQNHGPPAGPSWLEGPDLSFDGMDMLQPDTVPQLPEHVRKIDLFALFLPFI